MVNRLSNQQVLSEISFKGTTVETRKFKVFGAKVEFFSRIISSWDFREVDIKIY